MRRAAASGGKCNTCTIQLVRIAYLRAPWFRVLRGPLKWGMMALGWLYRVDPRAYAVPIEGCVGCLRFTKTELRERSAMFRWLNARINPLFDRILESIVTPDEVAEAKRYAALMQSTLRRFHG
ncbi:MAG: nitroreductase [Chloroflexi bacterium]|nr:nitroreductase [Chloroflexota bacterium]